MRKPGCRIRGLAIALTGPALLAGSGALSGQDPIAEVRGAGTAAHAIRIPRSAAPLELREAVARALGHDPEVAATRATSAAARAGHGRAKAAWWPEVGLSGSLTRYQEAMIVSPIHDFAPGETPAFDETLIRGGGYLRWTVFDGGGRTARVRRAGLEASAAEAGLDGAAQALIAEVAGAYLDVLGAVRVLAVHDRRLAALEAETDRVLQLREVGRAAEVEVLRVEAAVAAARADRVVVASELDLARRELARLMGAPPEEPGERGLVPVRLAPTAPEARLPDRAELAARAVEASPAVERARRLETAAEAGLSLARSVRWPDLQLFGDWIDHAGLDSDHNLEWSAGLRFSVPLFTGGRVGEGIAAARAETDAARERLRAAVAGTERAVDRTVSRVEEADARVTSLETAVARAREVTRIERLRLEVGTGTQTDYLDAEAELLSVEAALVEARHAGVRARVELARASGRLGPGWIEENLEGTR